MQDKAEEQFQKGSERGKKLFSQHYHFHHRAGGKGTAGTAMAVPVFEEEKMASLGF